MSKIIGISGQQGSGKTTLSTGLREHDPARTSLEKFAGPIYYLHDLIREEMFCEYGIRSSDTKDGNLLQYLGTEWGRNTYGQDVWTDCMANVLKTYHSDSTIVVIDDLRFENEFRLLKNLGATLIRLECSEELRKGRAEMWRENTSHPSETGLDHIPREEWDLVLDSGVLNTRQILDSVLQFINSNK